MILPQNFFHKYYIWQIENSIIQKPGITEGIGIWCLQAFQFK